LKTLDLNGKEKKRKTKMKMRKFLADNVSATIEIVILISIQKV
jgi:hypothetical protein